MSPSSARDALCGCQRDWLNHVGVRDQGGGIAIVFHDEHGASVLAGEVVVEASVGDLDGCERVNFDGAAREPESRGVMREKPRNQGIA